MEFEHLRPLSVGEVIDTAFRIYRTRFRDLILAVAVCSVPLVALQVLVNLSVTSETTFEQRGNVLISRTGPSNGVLLGVFAATILISALSTAIAQGASIRIIADQYLGSETSWRDSLRFALSKLVKIFATSILVWIIALIGLVACVLPGIYLWIALAVAIPVLLVEGTGIGTAVSRSRTLVSGRWWPTFGALLVIFLLTSLISAFLGALVGGGTFAAGRITGSTTTRLLIGLVNGGVTILLTPLSAAVTTIIYFDLRVRKEGFDVALMAQRLGLPAPSGSGTPWAAQAPTADPPWPTTTDLLPGGTAPQSPARPPDPAPGTPPPSPGPSPGGPGSPSPWARADEPPPAPGPPPPDA